VLDGDIDAVIADVADSVEKYRLELVCS